MFFIKVAKQKLIKFCILLSHCFYGKILMMAYHVDKEISDRFFLFISDDYINFVIFLFSGLQSKQSWLAGGHERKNSFSYPNDCISIQFSPNI